MRLLPAVAVVGWLAFSIGLHSLTNPDEGRYVGVAWEMLRSGDWIVPTENGLPFFHKPPLFYWITAASMKVFGINEWAARAAPLLAAVTGAAVLFVTSRRWTGARRARRAVAILVTMPVFFGAAQYANLDLLVATCIAVAICLAGDAVLRLRAGERYFNRVVAAWTAAALGVLAKGLIGVALPGAVIVVWLVITGQGRSVLRLLSPVGLTVFVVIAAPWFIAMQERFPGFAHFFFVYQHFERFAADGFNNVQPFWFYVVLVPLATLPWSPWLMDSCWRARDGEAAAVTLWRRLMWTAVVVVLLFFSIPQSKPPGYALPVLFPLAWLIADAFTGRLQARGTPSRRRVRVTAMACLGIAVATCLSTVGWAHFAYRKDNTAVGEALRRLRGPGEPVLFLREYFFDVPLHARLTEPAYVASDWRDANLAKRDNWRRELAEAARFDPDLAQRVLVDEAGGLAKRCAAAPLWVVVKADAESSLEALPGATRAAAANGVSLWRIPAGGCGDARGPTS
jgi:4-amino-4-deoxy-L-arabinose transferase-like glycosyltransferase